MKMPHLLVFAGCLSTLVFGTIVLPDYFTTTAVNAETITSESRENKPAIDHASTSSHDTDILAGEVLQLRKELYSLRTGLQHVATLENALKKLQGDVATLREDVSQQGSYSEYLPLEVSRLNSMDDSRTDLQDPIAAYLEIPEQEYQRMQEAENAFSAEVIDESWSAGMSRFISDTFENGNFTDTSLNDIECRSSTCRLSVHHNNAQTAENFIMKFSQSIAQEFHGITIHNEDGGDGQNDKVMFLDRHSG